MTLNSVRTALMKAGVSVAVLAFSSASIAQTSPSRTVPESVAPKVERTDTGISLPTTRLSAAPAGSENLSVRVDRVVVEGGLPRFANDVAGFARSVEGRSASVTELYAVAAQIEALYAQNGYILTRATVPPQELKNGATFRIVIVEGFIESIDTSKAPAAVRNVLARRLAPLNGRKGLTMADLERNILLAAKVPGLAIATTLVPGEQLGGARLVVSATHKPVSGGLNVGNGLSDAYDNWNVDARISLNSVLGLGEQIFAIGSTTTDFNVFSGRPMRRIAGLGFTLPIGNDGLGLTTEYLHADTNAKAPVGGVPIAGKFDRVAVNLQYPLILSRREVLNLTGGFELVNEHQTVTGFGVRLSEDRTRSFNAGLEWAKAVGGKMNLGASAKFTQGIDGLGARDQAEALATGILLSRQGSKPNFTKLSGALSAYHSLSKSLTASLVVRGQASLSGALPSAVQFSLDGGEGLSGFSLGSINADSGVTGRLELSNRYALGKGSGIAPYLFAAGGTGSLDQPTVLEKKNPSGWSLGGGVRTQFAERFYLNGELSRSHSNIFTKNQTRLMISAGVQF